MDNLDSMFSEEGQDINSMFQEEESNTTRAQLPEASLKGIAGNVALQSGEDFSGKYREIMAEYSSLGYSPTVENMEKDSRTDNYGADRDVLTDILADPDIPDDLKLSSAKATLDMDSSRYSLKRNLQSKALSTETEQSDNPEREMVRLSFADQIDEVNEHNDYMQGLLNTEVAKSNPTILSGITDLAQMMIPFVEQTMVNNIDKEDEAWPFLFLGAAKKETIVNALRRMPLDKQRHAAKLLIENINNNSSIFMDDPNDLMKMEFLSSALEDHYYGEGDEFIDNIIGLMDLSVVLAPVGKTLTNIGAKAGLASRAAATRFIRSRRQPKSVLDAVSEANPDMARDIHAKILADETDETALALTGTTKEDYLNSVLTPQVSDASGTIQSQVVDPDVLRIANQDGAIYYSNDAKDAALVKVTNKFDEAVDATMRTNMSQFVSTDNGVLIKATYGPREGGWNTKEDAVNSLMYQLQDYGITEKDITILGRKPNGEYAPVNLKDDDALSVIEEVLHKSKNKKGQGKAARVVKTQRHSDYLVQVNHDYKYNPLDVTDTSGFAVNGNFFDRGRWVPSFGSLTRHLVDPQTLFSGSIAKGASVAVERSASLERAFLAMGDELFGQPFMSLPRARQTVVYDILKEQNQKRTIYSTTKLVADGLSPAEIKTIRGFEKVQNTAYYLENKDLAKTLISRGNKAVVSKDGTKFFGKPIQKGNVDLKKITLLDSDTGLAVERGAFDLEELYEKGGSIVQLRRPVKHGDEMFTHVRTSNNPSASYTRAIRSDEKVLEKIDGYFAVRYDAPIFITQKVLNKDGSINYIKAVGTARNTKDAKHAVGRLASSDNTKFNNQGVEESVFSYRDDLNDASLLNREDADWDLKTSGGRSAQRVRGEKLQDSALSLKQVDTNTLGPVDAMVSSARSLSRRTAMRPYMEAMKQRFVDKYKHMLSENKFGEPIFPTSLDGVARAGEAMTAEAADAKSAWEYINYLENGYRNLLDDSTKSLLNMIAKKVGGVSPKGEEALYWMADNIAPTQIMKNAAFHLFLVANPIRQIIVQGHQGVQLAAIHPKYMVTQASKDMSKLLAMRLNLIDAKGASNLSLKKIVGGDSSRTEAEWKEIYQQYMDSGIPSSVDKQNLIAGSLTGMVEYSKFTQAQNALGTIGRGVAKGVRGVRKIGFDAGEEAQMMLAWLAKRDAKVQEVGSNKLSQADLDNVTADARNFTYNMNAAGDMPYNQNILNIPLQFLQVPHKALLQFTNRQLTPTQKWRLLGFSTLMYAPAGHQLSQWVGDEFWEDIPDFARDSIEIGMESAILNGMMTVATGEKQASDFGALAPYDLGLFEIGSTLFTTDMVSLFADSPSGQLLVGNNPRITNLGKSVARLMNPWDEYDNPHEFLDVVSSFLELSSGYNNAKKARYAWEAGQTLSSMNDVTDEHVTKFEAIMKSFGFPTRDESFSYNMYKEIGDSKKEAKEDAKEIYKNIRRYVLSHDVTNQDTWFESKAITEAWRIVGDKDLVREEVYNLIKMDARKGDNTMIAKLLLDNGVLTYAERINMVRKFPNMSDEQKEEVINMINILNEWNTKED